jgi:uncharacterized protein YwgA
MGKITNSKDLVMVLLYAKGHEGRVCEPINGKTRFMKMVFLFDREIRRKFNLGENIPDSAMPNFEAHDFGPFSGKVYEDLEFLVEMGLVEASSGNDDLLEDERREYEFWQARGGSDEWSFPTTFSLTDLGKEFVESKLKDGLSAEQWEIVDKFKARCTSASLAALLKYVYTRYPETTTRSTIRDQVLGR